MNILITGAGAIGVAMVATLLSSGANVSVYAQGKTYDAIHDGGVHRTGLFGELHFGPGSLDAVCSDYSDFPDGTFDYIVIAAKTMANPTVAAELNAHRSILKPDGRLVIMQNGWGNDAEYRKYFSEEQVWSARVITGFQRSAPNVSNITVHTAPVLIGSLYGLDNAPVAPLADAINRGGIPSEPTNEVARALWAKMLYNCTLNPLGAVLGVHYGALTECPESIAIMNDLIDEIFAVMQAAGYSTYWATPDEYRETFYAKLVPDTYHHNSSTLQDIRKKQHTEIDTLTGRIMQLGRQYHVPVPVNTMLFRLIKTMEANF